jgi:hypothetical protein
MRTGGEAQRQSTCPAFARLWVPSPAPQNKGKNLNLYALGNMPHTTYILVTNLNIVFMDIVNYNSF